MPGGTIDTTIPLRNPGESLATLAARLSAAPSSTEISPQWIARRGRTWGRIAAQADAPLSL